MSLLLPLLALALVDSTSFGTLVLPALLVIRRRYVDRASLAIYFATVCGFYFVLGVGLVLGLDAILEWGTDVLESRVALWIQLVLGIALAAWGILSPSPKKKGKDSSTRRIPTTYQPRTMVMLGLGAAVVEAATMLPYLGAIGLLLNADLGIGPILLILAMYCVVMVLPAIVLIGLADIFGERIWPRLERVVNWLEHESAVTLLWMVAIIGVLMIRNALLGLGFID